MSGGSEEHFSLQWNDFHSNLSEGFHALLKLEDLVDVTLAADNKYVQAHRLVLSVCSPYFKDLFRVNPCKHPTVILKGVGFQELVDILEFMYRGQVNVKQDSLSDFLKTAEMLQVKGLCENENSTKPSLSAPSSNPPPSAQAIKSGTQCVDRKPILRDTPATWSDDVSQPPLKRKRHVPPVQVPFVPSRVEDEPIVVSKPYEDDTSDEVEFVDVIKPKIEVSDDEKSNIEEGEINENRKSSFSNVFNETDDFAMQNASDSQFDPDFPCSSQNMVGVQSNDQGSPVYVSTARGYMHMLFDGFRFRRDYEYANKVYWKCVFCTRMKCRARLCSVEGSVFVTHAEHNHDRF